MNLEQEEKKSLIKNLIDLSVIDNEQNMAEMQFIRALAIQLGITDEVLNNLKDSEIKFTPPKDEFKRIEHMHRLMLLMSADNTFSTVEKDFIQNIGLRMGIRPQATTILINLLEQSENNILTPKEILNVYNTYYN